MMIRRFYSVSTASVILLLTTYVCYGDEHHRLTPMVFSSGCEGNAVESCWILAEGTITEGTAQRFREFIEGGVDGMSVTLSSPGGVLTEGVRLGRIIREFDLSTHISDACLSACAYAYLGGSLRALNKDELLGFHQFSSSLEIPEVVSQQIVAELLAYVLEMGVDARVFISASRTPPADYFFVDKFAARDLGITPPEPFSEIRLDVRQGGVFAYSDRQIPVGPYDQSSRIEFYCENDLSFIELSAFRPAGWPNVEQHSPGGHTPAGMLEADRSLVSVDWEDIEVINYPNRYLFKMPIEESTASLIAGASNLHVQYARSRAGGSNVNFNAELSDLERQRIALAFTHCSNSDPDHAEPLIPSSSDGSGLASSISDWSRATSAVLSGHTDWVESAAFSPDGRHILTVSSDRTARLWDTEAMRGTTTLSGHDMEISSAAFSPDGARIVTASWDGTARIWDAETGRIITTLTGHALHVMSAAFSPDGRRVVTASADSTARVWDAETGRNIATLTGHTGWLQYAAFSPNGQRIVTTSSDNSVRLWNAETGYEIGTLGGHTDTVWRAAFSPDGRRIVTASEDESGRVWDAETGRLVATLTGHRGRLYSASFSPDGARIVTAASDGTASIWDSETGGVIITLTGHALHVMSAAFSPDGRQIVTGSLDRTARVWDAATGRQTATLQHTDSVSSAAFSPDGQRIVTASSDNSARVWQPQ